MLLIFSECKDKDVCIGPIIKFAVFDALFGVGCSLMLIFGAHLRNHCLLVSWMVVTLVISTKYIWVVIANDWSNLEVLALSLIHQGLLLNGNPFDCIFCPIVL